MEWVFGEMKGKHVKIHVRFQVLTAVSMMFRVVLWGIIAGLNLKAGYTRKQHRKR
jgi:hypothetical protein